MKDPAYVKELEGLRKEQAATAARSAKIASQLAPLVARARAALGKNATEAAVKAEFAAHPEKYPGGVPLLEARAAVLAQARQDAAKARAAIGARLRRDGAQLPGAAQGAQSAAAAKGAQGAAAAQGAAGVPAKKGAAQGAPGTSAAK